ncbi:ABC transporter ATP-binding protein [Minwuia sp.]|uniref:ABC transporter ATP-binding protein n=1 Tax=Minwuia sp. TaxID=2493630 RepID=UPI003A92E71B
MKLHPNEIKQTGDDRPVDTLLKYVWRMSGYHQLWICLLALTVAALTMLPLELQRRIINGALESAEMDRLLLLGGLFFGVLLISGLLKFALRMYQSWLSESAVRYGRRHLLAINDRKKRNGDDSEESGRAVAIIGTEIDSLGGFVGSGLSQPVVNGGMLLAILGYMLIVEPIVAALGLALLIPQAVLVPMAQSRINRLIERRLEVVREMSDTISNDADTDETRVLIDRLYWNRIKTFFIKFMMKGLINLMHGLAPLGVLIFGGIMVINGQTSVGVVVAFISGFERMGSPLRELLTYYRVAAQASVQHKMIARWM